MKRFMFITDSLGAPRDEFETINIDNTWCNIVANDFPDAYEYFYHSKNGFDTDNLAAISKKEIKLYKPDVIVLQVGIVDCAPRALRRKELQLIRQMGPFSKVINKVISNNYAKISRIRNISYVDVDKFESNCNCFCNDFNDTEILAISIARPSQVYISKSPLIADRYKQYNEILMKVFGSKLIDPYDTFKEEKLEELFIADGYHLNMYGHNIVAKNVIEKLCEMKLL